MNLGAVVLAVAAGGCFALGSALQHHAAWHEPRHQILDPRLLIRLLHRRLWLLGRTAALAGVGLQALALRSGALSVVQPLMVSGLLLALPLEARLQRRRLDRRDLDGVVFAGVGLAIFLVAAAPAEGLRHPAGAAWAVAFGVATVSVGTCLIVARSGTQAAPIWLGVATGVVYGLTASVLKSGAGGLDDGARLVTQWTPYAYSGLIVAGLLLSQNAFQAGALAPSLTAITLVEPIAALIIGVAAFHEHLNTAGPRLLLVLLGAAAMAVGVCRLSAPRSGRSRRRDPAGDFT